MGTLKPQSNGPLYSNTVIGTLAVDWCMGLLHLIQRGKDWAGCDPAQSSPRRTKWRNSPNINRQCTNFISFDVALLPLLSNKLNRYNKYSSVLLLCWKVFWYVFVVTLYCRSSALKTKLPLQSCGQLSLTDSCRRGPHLARLPSSKMRPTGQKKTGVYIGHRR